MAQTSFDEVLALIEEALQYYFADPLFLKIALRIPGIATDGGPTGMMILACRGQACIDAKAQHDGTYTGYATPGRYDAEHLESTAIKLETHECISVDHTSRITAKFAITAESPRPASRDHRYMQMFKTLRSCKPVHVWSISRGYVFMIPRHSLSAFA